MLINAQRPEELRIAIVQGNVLENYKVDVAESDLTRGNIYRGVIASIQPSLNAAFIDYGVILRTNALDQTKLTLARDLAALLRLWKRVQAAAMQGKGTRLLYTDQDLILQALRDYLDTSIEEVLIDDDEAFQKAEAYLLAFMPRSKTRLIRYSERLPRFSPYDLEPQIDRIYERRVELQSGGSIVIDATEALTAIDVNSGRS